MPLPITYSFVQWQEVLKWWDEGAVAWQRQRREQEESWRRCEAQQRAAWNQAWQLQGPRAGAQGQAQPQAQAQWQVQWQGQHAVPLLTQQAQQAQQAQQQMALPRSPERPALLPAHPAAALERQQSGSGAAPPAPKVDSSGTVHTGTSSGGVSEPRPAKRQPSASQWAWEVRRC